MNETNMLPNYKEIFEEIGKQFNLRKATLLKRVLLITWPILLLIIIGYLLNIAYEVNVISQNQIFLSLKFVLPYLLFSVLYIIIASFIFRIEKQIWIDSFFDKRDLKPSESLKISMKLFWSALNFRAKLWLHFYFVPIAVFIALFAFIIQFIVPIFNSTNSYEIVSYSVLASFIIFAISLIVYGYYIKTKLRYSYFIFLDSFGKNVSFRSMIDEMNKLNGVSKSESFKKSLILNIGADSANSIAIFATNIIGNSVVQLGGAGRLLGNLIKAYGEEASRQITEFGNISAQYILYRFARKEVYGNEQEVNENIYKLINENL